MSGLACGARFGIPCCFRGGILARLLFCVAFLCGLTLGGSTCSGLSLLAFFGAARLFGSARLFGQTALFGLPLFLCHTSGFGFARCGLCRFARFLIRRYLNSALFCRSRSLSFFLACGLGRGPLAGFTLRRFTCGAFFCRSPFCSLSRSRFSGFPFRSFSCCTLRSFGSFPLLPLDLGSDLVV